MSVTTHRALRLTLASLLLVAMTAQLAIGMSRSGLTVVNFLSYFTILSNTLAMVLMAWLAFDPGRDSSPGFASFRGAVTVYMSLTGVIYAVVLAPVAVDLALTEPWVDWSLHVVGPIAVVLDWILDPPPVRLSTRALPAWLAFPAGYLAYTMIRGPIAHRYPYPILDPDEVGGYGAVAIWSIIVLVVILGFGALYLWWANRRSPQPQAA